MPMNIYTDTTGPTYDYAIHLDTAQVLPDGTPDPAWVRWYSFPQPDMAAKPQGTTNADYRAAYAAQCQSEAKLLAKGERQAMRRAARTLASMGTPVTDNS